LFCVRDRRDAINTSAPIKLDSQYLQDIRNTNSLTDAAYKVIRKAIISGCYKPGEQLKQLDLAAELDVSQRTVREALTRLVSEGLVALKPYKGFTVISVSFEEQTEIFKLRAALEGLAMEEATRLITDKDLERMRELIPFTGGNDSEESARAAREANREFHMIPVRATGQNILIRILEQIWDITLTYYLMDVNLGEGSYKSGVDDLADHTEIVNALASRNGSRAREAMVQHIKRNFETLEMRIKEIEK